MGLENWSWKDNGSLEAPDKQGEGWGCPARGHHEALLTQDLVCTRPNGVLGALCRPSGPETASETRAERKFSDTYDTMTGYFEEYRTWIRSDGG